jgi:hypothetical protein
MSESPNLLGFDVGVRDLEGHADREGQVGEVAVLRGVGFVEVDPSGPAGVVQARISEGEHGMDKGPGHGHRYQRETGLEVLQAPVRMAGSDQHDPDGDQAGDRCSQQNHVS